ncbi:MAG: hypothetical protein U0324_27740 [Polyangiales bacterium]
MDVLTARRALALAALVVACERLDPLPGYVCTVDEECGAARACVLGWCRDACSTRAPCAQGYCAPSGRDRRRACLPPDHDALCAVDEDCAGDALRCVGGRCRASCGPSAPCGEGACVVADVLAYCAVPVTVRASFAGDAGADVPPVPDASLDVAAMDLPAPPDVAPADGPTSNPVVKVTVAPGLVLGVRGDGRWVAWGGPLRGTSFPWATAARTASLVPALDGATSVWTSATVATLGALAPSRSGAPVPTLQALGLNPSGVTGTGSTGALVEAFTELRRGSRLDVVTDGNLLAFGAANGCMSLAGEREVQCWGEQSAGVTATSGPAVAYAPGDSASIVRDLAAGPRLQNVRGLAVGDRVACAFVSADVAPPFRGEVLCWGSDLNRAGVRDGALGRGTSAPPASPVALPVPLPARALSVHVSGRTACATLDGRNVHCWGDNRDGILRVAAASSGDPVDTGVSSQELALGDTFACDRDGGRVVRCWGRGAGFTQAVAPGTAAGARAEALDPGGGVLTADSIAAGAGVACAVRVDRSVVCWGELFGAAARPAVMPQ